MKIKLFKEFYAPDNRLLKPGVHEVPDDWKLPKSTKVLKEEEVEDDKPAPKKTAAK